METSVVCSGSGGQGAFFAGQILAYAAMESGVQVTPNNIESVNMVMLGAFVAMTGLAG